MIGRKQETQLQPEQQYTKEEYASMKQAEREDAWAKVDAQAQEVFKDDASMKGFLNFMAQCTPQSTRNLLILYNQNKEITHPRTFDKWKEAGRSIRSGEKGYTFFADQEYTKEDGNIANGYTITKAYDISQTRAAPASAAAETSAGRNHCRYGRTKSGSACHLGSASPRGTSTVCP